MSDLPDLKPHQRILWNVLCRNFPANICRTLEDTDHIHSDELHHLYLLLQSSRGETAAHLMTMLASLSQPTAAEMVDALRVRKITDPDGDDKETQATREIKPYFHSRAREQFWRIVLDLFEMQYLGGHADGSMRGNVSDFFALHILYRLDMEDMRCRRDEDTNIQNPAHRWYHETSDQYVAWCVKRLAPLVAKPWKVVTQGEEDDEGDTIARSSRATREMKQTP